MYRRQLALLHIGLAVAALVLGWRLGTEWRRGNQLRYGASRPGRPSSPVLLPTASSEQPLAPAGEIVAKNLFTPDRNNQMEPPERTQQPRPPVPIVFGTMNLGENYEALMAEGGASQTRSFRRVKNGERLGAYTVAEIRDDKVVVEYEGHKTTIDVYQSANSVPRPEARTTPAAAPVVETGGSPPPPPVASQQTTPATAAPGTGPEVRVTIEGNRRRFERTTPFGPQVWYEDIRK